MFVKNAVDFIKKNSLFLILITIGIVFFIRGVIVLDPDFGWHLREGGLILQNGIQRTDPFSYTMPSYQFIDHEWLTNVLIAVFYRFGGIYLLNFIFTIIALSSLYISVPKKYKDYSLIPLVLTGALMIGFFAIRPQFITWGFLALLIKLIFDEGLWKKWKYFVPLIFIPWVNLHGGFAIGIGIILLLFLSKILEKRKVFIENFLILLFSIIFTFINPYGLLIWKEIWMQMSDGSLRWSVSEWLPGVFYLDIAMLVLVCLSLVCVFRYRAKLKKEEIIIYASLLFMAISSIRHIPLFAIVSIPITSKVFYFFSQEVRQNKDNLMRFTKVKKILAIVICGIFLYEALTGSFFIKNPSYPTSAVDFLKNQRIKGQIMSTYNWGGYLIWKLPGKKVFVDGRMPSWRRITAPKGESKDAFLEWKSLTTGDAPLKDAVKKYKIDAFLLQIDPSTVNKNAQSLEEYILRILNIKNYNRTLMEKQIRQLGFTRIYKDSISVIYRKF